MLSNNLSKKDNHDEKEICIIKFNQIESEDDDDFVENNQTEADSGLNHSMQFPKEIQIKNKKTKIFKSFVEKPITKNFLNGGDFSELFINEEIKVEKDSSKNTNNKKFHTVGINKQESISSQLRGIFNNKEWDDESIYIKSK